MEKDKIFELRAETRTERSLGCQMTIAKKKFGRSDKPAAWRGPKPLKIAIFEAIRKKTKNRKNRFKIGWNHKKEELGCFPKDFFGTRGHPWGGFAPLKKITYIHSRQL